MNHDCDICVFLQRKPLNNQILTTKYWTVGIVPDQPYLGRALITLLTHKGSLGELSSEEWHEFESIVQKLEPAYEAAFGAKPLNIGNYMNHGYRDNPPHPHVHWQIFPRYKQPYELGGLLFDDPLYGEFYDDSLRRPVDQNILEMITTKLKEHLS